MPSDHSSNPTWFSTGCGRATVRRRCLQRIPRCRCLSASRSHGSASRCQVGESSLSVFFQNIILTVVNLFLTRADQLLGDHACFWPRIGRIRVACAVRYWLYIVARIFLPRSADLLLYHALSFTMLLVLGIIWKMDPLQMPRAFCIGMHPY